MSTLATPTRDQVEALVRSIIAEAAGQSAGDGNGHARPQALAPRWS